MRELKLRDIASEQEVIFPVVYKGQEIGRYIADIVVERKLLLELKCADGLSPAHISQTLNYLKASQIRIALLLNFGTPKLGYKRLIAPSV